MNIRFVIAVEVLVPAMYMLINILFRNNFRKTFLIVGLLLFHRRIKLPFFDIKNGGSNSVKQMELCELDF